MRPTLLLLAQAGAAAPEGLYDIVEPAPERSPWPLLLALALAFSALAALAWLVAHLRKRRAAGATGPSPSLRALRELDRIDRQRDDLPPNRFALAVSEALKDYFAERYQDRVRYETTDEFLARLAREDTRLPPAGQQELRDFLSAAEEVKFGNPPDAAGFVVPLMQRARRLLGLCESVSAPAPRTGP